MKLEVGMFCRVKGYIGKICNINEFREPDMEIGVDIPKASDVVFCSRDDITKASHSIIDLIQKGDYVNGYLVTTGNDGNESIYINKLDENGLKTKLYNNDIKSIVTKEMFEQISYKAGE